MLAPGRAVLVGIRGLPPKLGSWGWLSPKPVFHLTCRVLGSWKTDNPVKQTRADGHGRYWGTADGAERGAYDNPGERGWHLCAGE